MKDPNVENKTQDHPNAQAASPARRHRYVTPQIRTFSSEDLLAEIGPAQGYSGGLPGTGSGGGL